jgi:hypothetical protein
MRALRFIASLFLLGAVIALTADFSRPRQANAPMLSSFERQWTDVAPQSLATFQKTVRTRTHSFVWDAMIRPLLAIPTAVWLGGLSLLFFYLGRRRRRVEIFVN